MHKNHLHNNLVQDSFIYTLCKYKADITQQHVDLNEDLTYNKHLKLGPFRWLIAAIFMLAGMTQTRATEKFVLEDKLRELDYVLERRNTYYMAHEHKIDSLQILAHAIPRKDLKSRFRLNHELFNAYKSYQNDSARIIADRGLSLANQIKDPELMALAGYDDLFTYMSRGDFTSAVDVLKASDFNGVSDSLKAEYYVLAARLYSDLSNFTSQKYEDKYAKKARDYADSVMNIADPDSYASLVASYYLPKYRQKREERIQTLTSILNRDSVSIPAKAMLYSMLGDLYLSGDDKDLGLAMKAQSAILDIKAGIRETTSKHFLAYELFERGDVNRAAKYIHTALEDAEFYNAPQRKAEIGRALSLIESSRYSSVKEERNLLWIFLVIAIIVAAIIGALFLYIRSRNAKLKSSQRIIRQQNEEISNQNNEISMANDKLRSLNAQLSESIKIKDEYIGYVFYLNSEYITKLEKIYKLVRMKLATRQAEDLKRLLPISDIRLEKEKMLKEFDRIFLTLFPTFIEQYKSLFPIEDQDGGEEADGILTPEMRIFALIRIGVTNNANIAQFLNYSVNTINTYKTKAKKRSIVDNDEFESYIMQIRSVKS